MRVEEPRSCSPRFSLSVVFILLFAQVAFAHIGPEAGPFYFQQYSSEIYGAGPQNWAIAQDNEGVMFFGNSDGVLEYDGSSWRRINLKNGSTVRSLTSDGRGTIYVGGQNEFGYLKPDSTGTLQYASLVESVPLGDRRFGDVWTINVTPSGVLFSSERRLFRWSAAHGMKVWKPASRFGQGLYVVDGIPYVISEGSGLLRIQDDSLVAVPGGEVFSHDLNVWNVFRYSGSLVLAKPNGLYRYDGRKFKRFATGADKLLPVFGIYTCKVMKSGDLLLGTIRGGLIMLDSAGHLERIIDKSLGLASNSINAIYTDRDGETWLALNHGLAYIATELPLTQFGDREGLDEVVGAIQRQGGILYAGTLVGLSRMVTRASGVPGFIPVKGIQGVSNLRSTKRSLLAAGQQEIYEVTAGRSTPIFTEDAVYDLSLSIRDQNLIYVAGRRGLYLLHFDGRHWVKIFEEPSEGQAFRSVLEDSDGRVWATARSRILRINPSSQPPKIERFTSVQGVPGGLVYAYRASDQILFATAQGILHFDDQTRRFTPFQGFGRMFVDGSHGVQLIAESSTGDVWISGTGYHGILHRTSMGTYTWEENPLIMGGVKGLYALYLDPDNVAWASGSNGGLVRYKVAATSDPAAAFKANIRNVKLLRGDQTLFGGDSSRFASPEIKYQQNSIRFQYAASFFQAESRLQYQVRLDGLDRQWSPWAPEASKEYTNLSNGHYVFHVRARDLLERVSAEDSFAFRVLPPWYRSWWAYLLGVLACAGFVWLIVMWRVLALAKRNRRLEAIIHERTAKIRSQRDAMKIEEEKTEALLLNILPAPVADELRATGSVTPTAYDDVTICFTDFVSFTLSSEKVSAADLVTGLHRYFTAFDEIVGRYGLEKMKTIGDSYMFVGGLPERKASHAVDAVMAALEIVDVVADLCRTSPHWDIRVGVHSGPVIAGVVGVRKFAFDIWGETVNFASRFESSGRANRVNISTPTYELVRDFVECEPRGLIPIKEGRLLDMYFARHVRRELLDGDPNQISPAFSKLYQERFGRLPASIPSLRPALDVAPDRAGLRI